jgi:PII-like signaling protein
VTESDCLKLTTYFGERDRTRGGLLADRLLDLYGNEAVQTSVLLRGAEGFGLKHHLHTQRLLTLSEDLPIVVMAVDTRPRIQALLPTVQGLMDQGLITLERARVWDGMSWDDGASSAFPGAVKLTMYCGRQERIAGTPVYAAVVDVLRRQGVAGATVLLGVDGTMRGIRRRARFFSPNADVPLVITAVGDHVAIARALAEIRLMPITPTITLERALVCKRDGILLSEPPSFVGSDESGLRVWHKLSVYAGEQARHGARPLYVELIRRLRRGGAGGATAVRGFWGYHGDHAPHGDVLLSLRRRVPVITTVIDTAERSAGWFKIVDELTDETGLVTSEMVPASRAFGPGYVRGGTELAQRIEG